MIELSVLSKIKSHFEFLLSDVEKTLSDLIQEEKLQK